MMQTLEVMKRACTKCLSDFPRTLEHFPANRRMKDGMSSWCRSCHRINSRSRNPEADRQRALQWGRQHPDRVRARGLAWRENNAARKSATDRAWRQRNPERKAANDQAWRDSHRDQYLLGKRLREARRRALKRGASGTATLAQVASRIAYYGGLCWMCGDPWEHLDHVIPLSRGGSNWPSNLRPACAGCNIRKGNREIK